MYSKTTFSIFSIAATLGIMAMVAISTAMPALAYREAFNPHGNGGGAVISKLREDGKLIGMEVTTPSGNKNPHGTGHTPSR